MQTFAKTGIKPVNMSSRLKIPAELVKDGLCLTSFLHGSACTLTSGEHMCTKHEQEIITFCEIEALTRHSSLHVTPAFKTCHMLAACLTILHVLWGFTFFSASCYSCRALESLSACRGQEGRFIAGMLLIYHKTWM